jgi:hypothetical protein
LTAQVNCAYAYAAASHADTWLAEHFQKQNALISINTGPSAEHGIAWLLLPEISTFDWAYSKGGLQLETYLWFYRARLNHVRIWA